MTFDLGFFQPKSYEYNAAGLIFVWGGIPIAQGFPKGTIIRAEYRENLTETELGCDGEVLIKDALHNAGVVSVSVLAAAHINQLLTIAVQQSRITQVGTVPLTFSDLNGLDLLVATRARCIKIPGMRKSDTGGNINTWSFFCEPLIINHAGLSSRNSLATRIRG